MSAAKVERDCLPRPAGLHWRGALLLTLCVAWACKRVAPPSGSSASEASPPVAVAQAEAPRLVVVIVVDQLRGDEIVAYDPLWRDGFRRLLNEGRWYSNAMHGHGRTETAAGHATIATGVYPRHHGVVDKRFYDPEQQRVIGICDFGAGGCDPRVLRAPTLGDRLKQRYPHAKVVAVGQKDYSTSVLGGTSADLVVWSSYGPEIGLGGRAAGGAPLPDWLGPYYTQIAGVDRITRIWELPRLPHPFADRVDAGAGEIDCGHGVTFPHRTPPGAPGEQVYWAWLCSPDSDRAFTEIALYSTRRLQLGRDGTPDILWLSVSAVDVVGHAYGYESLERVAVLTELDRQLGDFLKALEEMVGDRLLVALTADHGVAPRVATAAAEGHASGRVLAEHLEQVAATAVGRAIDGSSARVTVAFPFVHVHDVAPERREAAVQAAAAALASLPEVHAAWPVAALAERDDSIAALMHASAFAGRSGDIAVVLKPWYAVTSKHRPDGGAEHGTPWDYDRHVPVLLWGHGVAAGRVEQPVQVIDLMRTLADRLGLAPDVRGGRPLP